MGDLAKAAADRVVRSSGFRCVPEKISRQQLAAVVDEVFGGAIEDTTIIEQIYAAAVASTPDFSGLQQFEKIPFTDLVGNRVPTPSEWFGGKEDDR